MLTEQQPRRELMDVESTCNYLQASRASFYKWRHNGTGPKGIKVGRRLLFDRSDLDAWLDSKKEV